MQTPRKLLEEFGPRESMEYDVVIVGAGPAGLATAIRLKQRAAETGREVSVCVLEKGSEPGAHILSGAIMDPRAITELLPNWKADGAPLRQEVTAEEVLILTETGSLKTPNALIPPPMQNHGNFIISLGETVKWLATQAEALGVEIFAGFAAAEVLFNEHGAVVGVATGHQGLDKEGQASADFQIGMELHAKYTVFAEGARGHLGKQLILRFKLDDGKDPQSYGIGIKELWEVDPSKAKPGLVIHTAGWPLDTSTYGGSFLYHMEGNKVAVGFVVGLDYSNPYLSPFEEFQRYKTHPAIAPIFDNARRLSYGARAIVAGGLLSLPKLAFPGGVLVGCDAGFLNAARIKGSHAAIKSGMLAAEAAFEALGTERAHDELASYGPAFQRSWLHQELYQARNFKQWFKKGFYVVERRAQGDPRAQLSGVSPIESGSASPNSHGSNTADRSRPCDSSA